MNVYLNESYDYVLQVDVDNATNVISKQKLKLPTNFRSYKTKLGKLKVNIFVSP